MRGALCVHCTDADMVGASFYRLNLVRDNCALTTIHSVILTTMHNFALIIVHSLILTILFSLRYIIMLSSRYTVLLSLAHAAQDGRLEVLVGTYDAKILVFRREGGEYRRVSVHSFPAPVYGMCAQA